MIRTLLLCFALASAGNITAQFDKILNDPDVEWAASFEVSYFFMPDEKRDTTLSNDMVFWKNYDPKDRYPYENGQLLIKKMIDAVLNGEVKAWRSAQEQTPLTLDQIAERLELRDTITVYDVESQLPQTKPIVNKLDLTVYTGVRVKHFMYYSKKAGEFRLLTEAFAPIRMINELEVDEMGHETEIFAMHEYPFWIKLSEPASSKKLKKNSVNQSSMVWAAEVRTLDNMPAFKTIPILKNTNPPVRQTLLDRFRRDPKYQVTDAYGADIPFHQREAMILKIDTITVFDPETYEEKTVVETYEIASEEVRSIRFVQHWYWDDRRKELLIHAVRFAPLVANRDPDGNFRFNTPLFYKPLK